MSKNRIREGKTTFEMFKCPTKNIIHHACSSLPGSPNLSVFCKLPIVHHYLCNNINGLFLFLSLITISIIIVL